MMPNSILDTPTYKNGVFTLDSTLVQAGKFSLLSRLAEAARSFAYAPISNFYVGAALLSGDKVYLGANYEFPDAPIHWTVHAEQSAYHNALSHGAIALEAIAVTATPCGHCRQFLVERCAGSLAIVLPNAEPFALDTLLPHSFSLDENTIHKSIDAPKETNLLRKAAYKAYRRSTATFSQSPLGIALENSNGAIVAGSYCESHAFNPSLFGLCGAMAAAQFVDGGFAPLRAYIVASGTDSQKHRQLAIDYLQKNSVIVEVEVL